MTCAQESHQRRLPLVVVRAGGDWVGSFCEAGELTLDLMEKGIPHSDSGDELDMSGALSPTEHLRAGLGSMNVSAPPDEIATSPILVKSARRRLEQSFDSPPPTPSVPASFSASVICQSPSTVETTAIFRSCSSDLLKRKEKGRERAGSFIQQPCPSPLLVTAPVKPMSRSFTSLPAFKPKSADQHNKENVPSQPVPLVACESPLSRSKRRSWRAKSTYLSSSSSSSSPTPPVKPLDLTRLLHSDETNQASSSFPLLDSSSADSSIDGGSILSASCSSLPFIFNSLASAPLSAHPCSTLPAPNDWPPMKHHLPVTVNHEHPDLPTIAPQTMSELLRGLHLGEYQDWYVIDCRFPYEFAGGHIRGALNMSQREMIEEFFFKRSIRGRNVLIIFYCEFSSKRGPSSFKHLREIDRKENYNNYPHLSYPNVYLLQGGYSNFFKSFKEYCDPIGYVQMFDKNFAEALQTEMRASKLSLTRSRDRGRSQSFSTLNF